MRARARAVPWLVPAAVLVAVATSACGGKSASSSGPYSSATSTPPAGTATTVPSAVRATLTAPTHRPLVNAPWTYVVRVRDASGRPLKARVHLQVLSMGVPVGQIGVHNVVGAWRETINWPPASAGHPLVVQAEVTAAGTTVKVNYPVMVRTK